jgi:hypothetical protein
MLESVCGVPSRRVSRYAGTDIILERQDNGLGQSDSRRSHLSRIVLHVAREVLHYTISPTMAIHPSSELLSGSSFGHMFPYSFWHMCQFLSLLRYNLISAESLDGILTNFI